MKVRKHKVCAGTNKLVHEPGPVECSVCGKRLMALAGCAYGFRGRVPWHCDRRVLRKRLGCYVRLIQWSAQSMR
jgi:hypothetical protein